MTLTDAIITELDLGGGFRLRNATLEDHAAMSMVCLKTGDSGRDATDREDDPELLGLLYAVPYQVFSPEFAFVVDAPGGVCGYVLGTPDSTAFYRWMSEHWLPPLAARLADPGPDESHWRGSDWARHSIHHPHFTFPPVLHAFPAHGHIDLLEEARGRQVGRQCMQHLMATLRAHRSPGLHLGVSPRNFGAQAFYRKLGFEEVTGAGLSAETTYMARRL